MKKFLTAIAVMLISSSALAAETNENMISMIQFLEAALTVQNGSAYVKCNDTAKKDRDFCLNALNNMDDVLYELGPLQIRVTISTDQWSNKTLWSSAGFITPYSPLGWLDISGHLSSSEMKARILALQKENQDAYDLRQRFVGLQAQFKATVVCEQNKIPVTSCSSTTDKIATALEQVDTSKRLRPFLEITNDEFSNVNNIRINPKMTVEEIRQAIQNKM